MFLRKNGHLHTFILAPSEPKVTVSSVPDPYVQAQLTTVVSDWRDILDSCKYYLSDMVRRHHSLSLSCYLR